MPYVVFATGQCLTSCLLGGADTSYVASGHFRHDGVSHVAINVRLLVVFPFHQSLRFLYPVLPFFFYFAFIGLARVSERLSGGTAPVIPPTVTWVFGVLVLLCGVAMVCRANMVRDVTGGATSVRIVGK